MRLLTPIRALALAILLCGTALAQEDSVKITSDKFVVNQGASEATFSGNVRVDQPDLTVWADEVVVHYGAGGPSDLESFVATGHVRIRQPEQTATSDKGVYDPETRILHLSGNVVVNNDSGTVSGPELEVNVATGLSEFTGSPENRVTGIFTPSGSAGE